jgi:hypothetical protein
MLCPRNVIRLPFPESLVFPADKKNSVLLYPKYSPKRMPEFLEQLEDSA